jgi:hypothetical protein
VTAAATEPPRDLIVLDREAAAAAEEEVLATHRIDSSVSADLRPPNVEGRTAPDAATTK